MLFATDIAPQFFNLNFTGNAMIISLVNGFLTSAFGVSHGGCEPRQPGNFNEFRVNRVALIKTMRHFARLVRDMLDWAFSCSNKQV